MTAISCFKPPGVALTRSGAQLAWGLVFAYVAGTTTAKDTYPTYADAVASSNANANPVQLDTQGNAQIWLRDSYKIVVGTNAGTAQVPVLGTTIETYDSYPTADAQVGSLSVDFIDGLAVAIDSGDTAHDVNITAGEARDGADGYDLTLATAIVKRVDAAWAVGTGNGGIDTGSVNNGSLYYIWLIARSDTGVVDALISLSGTAPTMPNSYDKKRLIGVAKYGTGAWSQMSSINRPWQQLLALWPDSGVANGYIITPYPAISLYAGGQRFSFVAGFGNTGASTLNVNGLGTKAIRRNNTALTGNEIVTGAVVTVMYDAAAGVFELQSPWESYGVSMYCGTSAGTDTVTATAAPAIGAYVVGQHFSFKAGGTNTGAVTLNLNSVGAGAVQKYGAALVAGDITANDLVEVVVSAVTPVFQLVSPWARNLGTPTTLVLTNATGLPISTGVSGLAANVATFLATPTSANLAAALTDETGTGANVFAGDPTLTGTITAAAANFSGKVNVTGGDFEIKGQQWQGFTVIVSNAAGTIKHAMYTDNYNGVLGNFIGKVSGASASATATPTVSSGTDFTAGAGINTGATNELVLNTAAQTAQDNLTTGYVDQASSLLTNPYSKTYFNAINVNGVTRARVHVAYTLATTGGAWTLNTTNIPAGDNVQVRVTGPIA